jgi:hypothetical protein
MTVTRAVAIRLAAVAVAVFALALIAGCASMTVSHLESRPVNAGPPTTLAMQFWRFEFAGVRSGGAYRIRGRATPVTDDLPPWVDRLESLTLTAYLRDPAGHVLASSEKTYKGMALTPGAAIPFECTLSPAGQAAGDYGISFGYKAVYGSSKVRAALDAKGPPPAGAVFFAGEGAVLKH